MAKKGKEKTIEESRRPKIRPRWWWLRSVVQLLFLILLLDTPVSRALELGAWTVLLPVVPIGVFDALQISLSSPAVPFLPIALIFLSAVVLGRLFCGWACPFGFVQDLLGHVRKKHFVVSLRTHNQLKNLKYVVLGTTLLVSGSLALSLAYGGGDAYREALGIFAEAPYTILDPAVTLFVAIPETILKLQEAMATTPPVAPEQVWTILASAPYIFYVRIGLLIISLLGALYVPRFWCRYFCPLGALMSLFSRFSFLGMKRDPVKCTKCPRCVEKCSMVVRILDLPWEKFNDAECIMCLDCMDACPRKALKPKIP